MLATEDTENTEKYFSKCNLAPFAEELHFEKLLGVLDVLCG
jgi:apolipoprotein N-acyltransferase